ncbi:HET and ankyrin domain protein [Fusarium falciforme]|uniref:HET and ankyrin domain protein n=1 Tax=Fusarium falciforme TaxID=195108 RepID=UPI00230027B6|nr:HET and ankyrin domain protein [Fusarium falciforme]WAO87254.1 HET and ankyrin domain protein [Fusarium falciforme]
MYRWYQEAEICYAYLADVPSREFSQSRWFTRGWTLQELIAPSTVIFFDKEWEVIGTKSELARLISDRTQISIGILSGGDIWSASVAQRMSWVSKRKTTRIEDLAYCLMGIFDIHMPMIYGEGERAFIRLQEQIMKTSDDFSLFAWRSTENHGGLLATSPAAFDTSHSIVRLGRSDTFSSPISVDNQGVHLKLRFIPQSDSPTLGLAVLNCTLIGRAETPIAIYLETTDPTKQYFRRVQSERLHLLDQHDSSWPEIAICVQQPHETPMGRSREVTSFRQRRTGTTPLLYAAKRGHKSTVTDLLNWSDVEPNSMDETGRTALWVAAENGHEEVVTVLRDRIDVKADLKDANGRMPLWIAASNGHEQVVRALLDRIDVEADSKDADGWTPLAIAASKGHEAIVKMMEQRGQASQTLACPFSKHYPHKKWPRCQRGWESVHRIRKHIYRAHALRIHCDRCFKEFKEETDLEQHRHEAIPCQVIDAPNDRICIKEDIIRKLRSRKRVRNVSTEERWKQMYAIIFPDVNDKDIPTPYYHLHITDITDEMRAQHRSFLRREVPDRVIRELAAMLNEMPEFRDDLRCSEGQLSEIIHRSVWDTFDTIFPSPPQPTAPPEAPHDDMSD